MASKGKHLTWGDFARFWLALAVLTALKLLRRLKSWAEQ